MAVYDLDVGDLGFSSSLWTPSLFRLSNGEVCRAGVISERIKFSYVHYHKKIGSYFKCFSERDSKGNVVKKGSCCNLLGLPTKKYGMVVIADKNTLNEDFKWGKFESLDDVKVWTVGEKTIKSVLNFKIENGGFKNFDLRVVCNNEKFQSLSFVPILKNIWSEQENSDKLIAAADELAEEKVLKYLGKDIDESLFKEIMSTKDRIIEENKSIYNTARKVMESRNKDRGLLKKEDFDIISDIIEDMDKEARIVSTKIANDNYEKDKKDKEDEIEEKKFERFLDF